MAILRWISALPAGILCAILVTFPVHWAILFASDEGRVLWGILSINTAETLAVAFTTPFFIIYSGAWVAPTHKIEAGIGLSIIVALFLGGMYVLAFTYGEIFRGWNSLNYGITPLLNLLGIGSALFIVRNRYKPIETQG